MSQKVKQRLEALLADANRRGLDSKTRMKLEEALRIENHELRREIDRIIEERTGMYCDYGIDEISDKELLEIIEEAKKRLQIRKKKEVFAYAV